MNTKLRTGILVLALVLAAVARLAQHPGSAATPDATSFAAADRTLAEAFENRQSHLQITGQGVVAAVLSDDEDGTRHQRFILRLANGQSVLVAHNIDLAPRIESLKKGDVVAFNGEYEWNPQGGVIHWTHRDPGGRHPDGWLRQADRIYQ